MSRGGRGGRGGGPRAKAGMARIGGLEIAYDEGLEESLKTRPQPLPLFPTYPDLMLPQPLTAKEQRTVSRTLQIRARFHASPLYSTLAPEGSSSATGRGGGSSGGSKTAFNPFEDIGAYSDRYKVDKRARRLPDLRSHWKVAGLRRARTEKADGRFMPRELWGVIGLVDPAAATATGGGEGRARRGRAQNGAAAGLGDAADEEEGAEGDEDERKIRAADEDGEEAEDVDDAYDTDEEDMGGDYNAEQYFDDGGEDGEDGGDDGGADYE